MKISILTIFPEILHGYLGQSIMKRAADAGLVEFRVVNLRDHTTDRHRTTDDAPYGGGPGMVMKPEPIAAAFDALDCGEGARNVYLSPQGKRWTQRRAEEFAALTEVNLLCGHYEGVDERIIDTYIDEEISIGDYVLTGGELAALVMVDSIVRLLPGVLGNSDSAQQDSFSSDGLLDYPHYTRPEIFRGQEVPEVLRSGNHTRIDKWRREQSLSRTATRRPDLLDLARQSLNPKELAFIKAIEKGEQSADSPPGLALQEKPVQDTND